MNKFKQIFLTVGKFLKKNVYYVLIVVCIAAIGTMVTVSVVKNKRNDDTPVSVQPSSDIPGTGEKPAEKIDPKPDDGDKEPEPAAVLFAVPVANAAQGMAFSDTEPVFSKTLKQWSVHLATDYIADEGTPVVAAYDGVVKNVENNELLGYTVTINHTNGLETRYCSLGEDVPVIIGQSVKKGQQIGEVSNSMLLEISEGAHLHFEVWLNDELVDPAAYYLTEEK